MKSNQSKILIVDDMQQNLHDMVNCLFAGGYFNVLCAINGVDAMEVANKEIPDLILLDWDMPGMSGIEVLEKLKSNTDTSLIPVIIATGAMLSATNLEQALAKGAVDYIRKPFESIELLARVKSAMDFSSMYSTIQSQHQEIIAQKKSLERNEKRLKALLNASVEACVLVEKDLIIEANKVFCDSTGYSPAEVLGQSFMNFLDAKSRITFASYSLQIGQSFSLSILKKEGDILPVEVLSKKFEYNQKTVLAISIINLNQFSHIFEEERISELMVQTRKINELSTQIIEYAEENRDLLNQLQFKDLQDASCSEFMEKLSDKMDDITGSIPEELESCRKEMNYCIHSIKQKFNTGRWNEFKLHLARVHPDFYVNLLKDFPNFTEKDLRLCALIKLNLSIKESASISNVLPNTIKVARRRLRAKMNLKDSSESLAHVMAKY